MNSRYKGLAHIAIRTMDVDKSIEFYEKMGARLVVKDSLPIPEGRKTLALVALADVTIELIQIFEPVEPGVSPHFAVYVDDLDAMAAELMENGIDSFNTPHKLHSPLFGGLDNWFINGPSGEQIELIQA